MKNIIKKHKKAKRRMAERRKEGLAIKASMKGKRRKKVVPPVVLDTVV
jgi:hypothetical protein